MPFAKHPCNIGQIPLACALKLFSGETLPYKSLTVSGDKVAVLVDGVRSPFVKSFGEFGDLDCLELFSRAVSALLRKVELPVTEIDEVSAGVVVPQPKNPNVARDTIINLNMPSHIHGSTTNRACTSSLQTVANAASAIGRGQPSIVLAGGVEILSNMPIVYSEEATKFLVKITKARSNIDRLKMISHLSAKDWIPKPPSLLEPLTGYTMGQHAEQMAKLNTIPRQRQDEFALASHDKAARARREGVFADEIFPIWPAPKFAKAVTEDNLIRDDADIESLAKLRPVFDRKYGSITAGSSSPLTDGAAVAVIADQKRITSLGFKPKAKIVDFLFVGVDPFKQLLIGPAIAIPLLLHRNKLAIKDLDLVEVHEAFAAQILSCQQALASADFFTEHFATTIRPCGEIPDDKLNVNGGAIAIGHPFGATGVRLLLTLANELQRRDGTLGLISICAAGGMAGAMLIERVN